MAELHKSEPKRHHYLPEFYLKGFSRETEAPFAFWVYDRKEREFRPGTPHGDGNRREYYTFTDSDGRKRREIETGLLSRLDGDSAPVIRKLRARELLDPQDREVLALFVAFLHTRGPEFDALAKELAEIRTRATAQLIARQPGVIEKLMAQLPEQDGRVTPERMRQFFLRDDYLLKIDRKAALLPMLHVSFWLAQALLATSWSIIYAPQKKSFVTSDNPVVGVWPNSSTPIGFLAPEVMKLVPLAQDVLLLVHQPGGDLTIRRADDRFTRKANNTLSRASMRFIVGRDEALLRAVVERPGVAEPTTRRRVQRWGHSPL